MLRAVRVYRPLRPVQPVDEKNDRKETSNAGVLGYRSYRPCGRACPVLWSRHLRYGFPWHGQACHRFFCRSFPAVQYLVYRYRKTRSVPGAPAQAAGNGTGDPGPAYSQSAGRQVRDSTRSWHFDVDTSTWPPDEYLVVATSIQPRVTATARFCVAEPPAGYLQPALFAPAKDPVQPENQSYAGIGIDPVPDHYTGDRFAITGHDQPCGR